MTVKKRHVIIVRSVFDKKYEEHINKFKHIPNAEILVIGKNRRKNESHYITQRPSASR